MLLVGALVIVGLLSIVAAQRLHERKAVNDSLDQSIEQVKDRVVRRPYFYDTFYYVIYGIKKIDVKPVPLMSDITVQQKDDSVDNYMTHSEPLNVPEIGSSANKKTYELPTVIYIISSNKTLHKAFGNDSSATMSDELVKKATPYVITSKETLNELHDLGVVYKKKTSGQLTYVAFTDILYMSSWLSLTMVLFFIGIFLIAALLAISLILSKMVVHPVAHAWNAQRQFIADASHDLKTPLSVISANTAILKSKPEAKFDEQSPWIESTQEETDRMLTLINRMLTLAKIEDPILRQEAIKQSFTSVNFSELIEELSLQSESLAFDYNSTITTEITPELYIFANKDNIRTLVGTLIENACKHSGENDHITVKLKKSIGNVVFSVNNAKSFIKEEDIENIFDRFYRSDKSRTNIDKKRQGHGLGLAIAQAICVECGGTLTVESTKQAGTTFIAQIPIGKKNQKK